MGEVTPNVGQLVKTDFVEHSSCMLQAVFYEAKHSYSEEIFVTAHWPVWQIVLSVHPL